MPPPLAHRLARHHQRDEPSHRHRLPQSRVGVGNIYPLIRRAKTMRHSASVSPRNLSAFVYDYATRQKMEGTTLNYFIFKQLPVIPPEGYREDTPWEPSTPLRDSIATRVLELVYTAEDLRPLAEAAGHDESPYRWDEERRFHLRSELDAAFFHLYGVEEQDAAYILDTFPIIKRQDEKTHGDYRTKRAILTCFRLLTSKSPPAKQGIKAADLAGEPDIQVRHRPSEG